MKSISVLAVRLSLLFLALSVSAFAVQMERDTEAVFTFPVYENGEVVKPMMMVEGASASLTRTSGGISAAVRAHGLPAGHAVTMWLVSFNHPEYCTDDVCDEDDVLPPPGNSDAGVGLHFLDGQVVNAQGDALFIGTLANHNNDYAVFGPGIEDAFHAELHIVLRSHGPASDHHDILTAQLNSMNGGCDPEPPHAPCQDLQFAVFK